MDNLEDPSNRINAEATTSSNEPSSSSKKRKLSDDQYQNEYKSMKEQIDKQQKLIFNQANTICELHNESRAHKNIEHELERMKKGEAELQSKIVAFEEQKKMTQAELVKLKSDMNDQLSGLKKQIEEKDNEIKELQLFAKDIKPDYDHIEDGKTKHDKINELKLTCERHEKKIKELEAQLQSKANTETSLRAKMTQMQQSNDSKTKLLQAENNRFVEQIDKRAKEHEEKLQSKENIVAELQFDLENMRECYKVEVKKHEEVKKLLNEHEKKMVDMKAEMQRKFDNEKKEHADQIKELNLRNADLLKKIAQNREAADQHHIQIKELNDKITVAKNFNNELYSQNEELKQKELNARAEIIDREKQIQDLQNKLAEFQREPTELEVDKLCEMEDGLPTVLGESADSNENEPVHADVYGRKNSQFPDWMKKVVSRRFPYIAQLGDKVVYFPQGHLNYIEECKKQKISNKNKVGGELNSEEFAIIENIEYKMSPYRSNLLTLAITDRNYVRTNKRIKFFHHDFVNIPDFIVLRQFYDSCVRYDFKKGDEVEAVIDDRWWTGTVQERNFAAQGDFNGSQLNSVVVKWDNETSHEKLSPWELQPLTSGRRNATTATSEDHELFSAYTVEMESWPLPPGGPNVGRNSELARDHFFNKLIIAIQELNTLPLLSPFQQPVNLQQFPDYAEIVVYPIDLQTIYERIINKYYRSLSHLKKDIQMIAINATKFNQRSSEISIDSKRLVQTLFHILDTVTPPDASEYFHSLEEISPSELTAYEQDLSLKSLRESAKRRDHRSASSTNPRGQFQSAANIKDVWMNDCRTACDQIFNEQAKQLLQENEEEESIDAILKKFEERGYKSPDELHTALGDVIQGTLNNCDRRSAKHRSLNSLIQFLNNKFEPIMEKYTRMANERTNFRQQRAAALNASSALNRIELNAVESSPSIEVINDSYEEDEPDYEEEAVAEPPLSSESEESAVNTSASLRPRKKETRKRRQVSSDSATSRSSEENIPKSSRKRKAKDLKATPRKKAMPQRSIHSRTSKESNDIRHFFDN